MPTPPTCVLASFREPSADKGHALDRPVQIGSLTKVLTGTLLDRLTDAGVADPQDLLERYLPVPSGTGITLEHLLRHTSGLPRLPPGLRLRDPYRDFDAEGLLGTARALDELVERPPGAEREYSNLGYALLGAALSKAGGGPYEDLLHRYVLRPLGLETFTSAPDQCERLVSTGLFGRRRRRWTMTGAVLPAGGMWAAPREVAALVQRLLLERRLGPPTGAWQRTGILTWHNGGVAGASVFAGATDGGDWIVVHRLARGRHDADGLALDLLRAELRSR